MIIETRVYDLKNKKMVYMPPLQAVYNPAGDVVGVMAIVQNGMAMAARGTVNPVMMKTPMIDIANQPLWEGDIIDCDIVNEFGSLTKARAMIRNRPDKGGFIVQVEEGTVGAKGDFTVVNMKKLGNFLENPELKLKQNVQV